jgi:predicted nucleic acid-binding protein
MTDLLIRDVPDDIVAAIDADAGRLGLSRSEYLRRTRREPHSDMEQRAVEVQALLADQGRHRAPAIPDLLVAAVAERAGLTVLHLDKDFELIAEVTAQPVERLRTG